MSIIINKPRISVAFVQDIYICYFLHKGKLVVGSLLSEGRYFPGIWDLLTPVTFYHYFRRFATFEGLLLSELYGVDNLSQFFVIQS